MAAYRQYEDGIQNWLANGDRSGTEEGVDQTQASKRSGVVDRLRDDPDNFPGFQSSPHLFFWFHQECQVTKVISCQNTSLKAASGAPFGPEQASIT